MWTWQGTHQVGAYEPDAAVDVEAHPARGHHCFWVAHVEGCHIPNRKAVPRMSGSATDRCTQQTLPETSMLQAAYHP